MFGTNTFFHNHKSSQKFIQFLTVFLFWRPDLELHRCGASVHSWSHTHSPFRCTFSGLHYKENLIPLSHCVSQPVFTSSFPLTSHANLVLKNEMARLITHVYAHVCAYVWRERWCVYKEKLSVCNCYGFF